MNSFIKCYEKVKKIIRENFYFLLSIIAIIFIFNFELPYVIYTPGGSIDLKDRILVENGYKAEGALSMAYVSMMKGNIPFMVLSFFIPNWDIVRTQDIKSDNESLDEMIEADRISMVQAQDNAIMAAYSMAHKDVQIKEQVNHIVYIDDKANTNLKLFDILLKVNGESVQNLKQLQNMVQSMQAGDKVLFEVKRDDEIIDAYATVYDTDDGLKVGVAMISTYEYETDPKIQINSKESESGPSGGLMMALSIYNALVEKDITKGKNIIGTGTIDEFGNVGKIGGVKYKILGASKKGADIFLVPEENYEEAIEVKQENDLDIRVISVKTLQEAIEAIS